MAEKQVPDLADLFPLATSNFRVEEVDDDGWAGFVVAHDATAPVPTIRLAEEPRAGTLRRIKMRTIAARWAHLVRGQQDNKEASL